MNNCQCLPRGFKSFEEPTRRLMVVPDGPGWPIAAAAHLLAALLAVLLGERDRPPVADGDCGRLLAAIEDLAEVVRSLRAPEGGGPPGASAASEPGHLEVPAGSVGVFGDDGAVALGVLLGLLVATGLAIVRMFSQRQP